MALKLSDIYCLQYKVINLYFCLKSSLRNTKKKIVLFLPLLSFPIQLYSVLCLSELFLPVPSPPNITITTKTSLSFTTLTPTSVLPNPNKLLYVQQVCALSLFLILHASKQHSLKNFSHCLRKNNRHIL